MKAAVVAPDGSVTLRRRQPTLVPAGPEALFNRATDFVAELSALVGGAVTAVGLSVPGELDERAGVVRSAVNLGWRNLELTRKAEQKLGIPVALGHDVRLGGVAEGALGAARGTEDFLFVPIGTGIAAAVVLGGRPRAGAHSLAGEFGHLVVQPDGPVCSCGGRGCLETMASAAAIARRYREQAGASQAVGTAEVEALARAGDPVAMGVWQEAISLLGRAFALAQSLLDVDLIVVGGGLANAGERLVGQLQATISPLLPVHVHFRLVLAELGDEASCLGAALLARSSPVVGRHR